MDMSIPTSFFHVAGQTRSHFTTNKYTKTINKNYVICSVRKETDVGNSDERCSSTVVMSLCSRTKGVCRHVSIPTLKSVLKPRKSV